MSAYAELQAVSHYSFLRGASSPEELFAQAAELGIEALGIADRNSLAGAVRAHEAAKVTGVRLVVGSRLDLADGASVIVYPQDRAAYGRLTRLLTLGKGRAGKGRCHLEWDDLAALEGKHSAILVPDEADERCAGQLSHMANLFGREAHVALSLRRRPNERLRLHDLANLGTRHGVASVVTGDVLFHAPERRILQDVVTCIREGCTIDEAGFRRERHADRHLKAAAEMHRLFADHPEALRRTVAIADRCRFSLGELKYQYPNEQPFPGLSPQEALEKLTWEGAAWRFADGVPANVQETLRHELGLIGKMGYAPYFLTVHAIVHFARSKEILCQGRGSAANSVVCYVLGITEVDPLSNQLLFERFVSEDRNEPPDIDVDFEHERREEVIQWIYRTYGRDRAALCATVIRYRPRGALRDVGKVFGLTDDVIRAISSQVWNWGSGIDPAFLKGTGLNLEDRRLRLTLELAQQLVDTPRHLSQHPGGFVLTNERLDDLVPVEPAAMQNRQVIEWDKDDIEILGFMKMDVLGLGMLGCLRRGFDFLKRYKPDEPLNIAAIKVGDEATYDMICRADTIGTFQIESRAQMSMLPRLKPREIYDLVVQIAIVRPGPIQGDMVHPYLRRREQLEPVEYPIPELRQVLGKTYGVPLFQEQAMRVAIECAGFSASEADRLRRSMATFKAKGGVSEFRGRLIEGMKKKGLQQDFAERIFRQLEGFGSYGFPESHAASFAILAYASAWMKCHHPEIFCAALLNAQPMGFYAPAQIVRDAREHGVEVRPPCVNASAWDCTLERREGEVPAVRLGFRMVKGFGDGPAERLIEAREAGPFLSLEDVWRRAGVPVASLTALAEADAYRPSLALSRREAFWAIKALRDEPLPLFAAAEREQEEPAPHLAPMSPGSEVVEDYRQTGLSLRAHPLLFLRESLSLRGFRPAREATGMANGALVETAGLVLMRQRPGSAKGVLFITIEDETGIANLVLWRRVFEGQRRVVLGSKLLGVRAVVQKQGEVVHLVARRLFDLSAELGAIGRFTQPQGRGDGVPPSLYADTLKTKSRDFR